MLESDVRGFHVNRAAWTPVLGEELTAEKESSNSEDPFALKRGGETVGHVAREISKIYWLFIHRGSLTAEVTLYKTGDTHSAFHTLARDRAISTIIVRGSNNSRYYDFEEQNYNNLRTVRKIFNFFPTN